MGLAFLFTGKWICRDENPSRRCESFYGVMLWQQYYRKNDYGQDGRNAEYFVRESSWALSGIEDCPYLTELHEHHYIGDHVI